MRQVAVSVLLFTLVTLVGPSVLGQEPPTPGAPPAAETTPEAPQPIPAPEIVSQSEQVNARIRGLRERLAADTTIGEIDRAYQGVARRIDELTQSWERRKTKPRTLQEVNDSLGSWATVESQLLNWRAALTTRVQQLESSLNELKAVGSRWGLTLATAADQELPEASIERIRATLASIGAAEVQLQENRDLLLAKQEALSTEVEALTEVTAELTKAADDLRRNILAADRPPLWRTGVGDDHVQSFSDQVAATFGARHSQLKDFVRDREGSFALLGIVFVLLLVGLYALRRRSRSWTEEDGLETSSRTVLERPISGAILVTALLTPILYTQSPQIFRNLVGLIVLIPGLRMIIAIVPPGMHRVIYALIPFYILDRVVEAITDFSPTLRVVMILDAALACAAATWALASLATSGVIRGLYLLALLMVIARVLDVLIWATLKTPTAQKLPSARKHAEAIFRRSQRIVRIGLGLLWIDRTLRFFALQEPTVAAIKGILSASIEIGAFSFSLGGVLAFVGTIWLSFAISRFIRFELDEDVMPRMALPRGVPQTVSRLVHYAILLVGFLIAVTAAGIGFDRLVLLTGALGVGIGFGLQSVVNNFVSGLILLFERPIKVGDVVEVGTLMGTVRRIGMRASSIRTWSGAEVIVPNGNLVSSEVINWTLSDRTRRVELAVGVAYGNEPQAVIDVLLEAARKRDDILDYPAPSALFVGFGDSSLDFELRGWTDRFDDFLRVKSALAVDVCGALAEAGIQIPFPQRDLHLKSVDVRAGEALTMKCADEPPAEAK
jgi:small-conductance mechanosensitive channel